MTKFVPQNKAESLCKLIGEISQYKCTRTRASFVYSESDQNKLGVVAIAAALAGMGGQAAAATAAASAIEEEADFVEFILNGDLVEGWVWRSPFSNGDIVEVAAQWQGDRYEAFGIARPSDKMIALYPHCSRALGGHIRNTVKWWLICNFGFYVMMVLLAMCMGMQGMLLDPVFYQMYSVLLLFFGLMFFCLSRQYMPFVRLAERVFLALGLPNAKNVDLTKSSKQQRTAEDTWEFGTFYFRY